VIKLHAENCTYSALVPFSINSGFNGSFHVLKYPEGFGGKWTCGFSIISIVENSESGRCVFVSLIVLHLVMASQGGDFKVSYIGAVGKIHKVLTQFLDDELWRSGKSRMEIHKVKLRGCVTESELLGKRKF
jgi:hypothetical protein